MSMSPFYNNINFPSSPLEQARLQPANTMQPGPRTLLPMPPEQMYQQPMQEMMPFTGGITNYGPGTTGTTVPQFLDAKVPTFGDMPFTGGMSNYVPGTTGMTNYGPGTTMPQPTVSLPPPMFGEQQTFQQPMQSFAPQPTAMDMGSLYSDPFSAASMQPSMQSAAPMATTGMGNVAPSQGRGSIRRDQRMELRNAYAQLENPEMSRQQFVRQGMRDFRRGNPAQQGIGSIQNTANQTVPQNPLSQATMPQDQGVGSLQPATGMF